MIVTPHLHSNGNLGADAAVVETLKVEQDVDTHFSLSTPTQELRRSPRKRTTVSSKKQSGEETCTLNQRKSKYFSSGLSLQKPLVSLRKVESDNDDVLPALPLGPNSAAKKTISTTSTKRRTTNKSSTSSPLKKVKREYAPPEIYAHLNCLSDYLQEHLDGTSAFRRCRRSI